MLRWWRSPETNPRGIPIYPSIALERLGAGFNWPAEEIAHQLELEKTIGPRGPGGGFILWNIGPLARNQKGIAAVVATSRDDGENALAAAPLPRGVYCAMFAPGQKVACVDDQFPLGIEKIYTALPKKDAIYTVRDLVPGVSLQNTEGETAIYLVELVNPANRHGIEYGFNAERFAPLETDDETLEEEVPEEAYAEEEVLAARLTRRPCSNSISRRSPNHERYNLIIGSSRRGPSRW